MDHVFNPRAGCHDSAGHYLPEHRISRHFLQLLQTKEKIFDILLIKVTNRVRTVVQHSRCPTDDLEIMLTRSQAAVLRELISINGAARFFELNQHHIRARLFSMAETREMLEDLKQNILRLTPVKTVSPDRLTFIATTILTIGLESLLYMARNPLMDSDEIARLAGSMAAGNVRAATAFLSALPSGA